MPRARLSRLISRTKKKPLRETDDISRIYPPRSFQSSIALHSRSRAFIQQTIHNELVPLHDEIKSLSALLKHFDREILADMQRHLNRYRTPVAMLMEAFVRNKFLQDKPKGWAETVRLHSAQDMV